MKRTRLAALFLSAAACMPGAQAQSYLGGNYELRNSSAQYTDFNPSAGVGISTMTHHHRWGGATGIGSSSMQTTAATAEDMPRFRYTPTSVSPALTPIRSNQTLQSGANTFSGRISSPALAPLTNELPGFALTGSLKRGAFEGKLPANLTGESYSLFGLQGAHGNGSMTGGFGGLTGGSSGLNGLGGAGAGSNTAGEMEQLEQQSGL